MEHSPEAIAARQAFSIQEFCYRNGISNATYHKLKGQKRGPREMILGRAIRISIEAERDWRAQREQPTDTEARLIKREAQARVRQAKKAAQRSVTSPKHVSKRTKAGA
jgi:hypothetical protein